MPAYVVFGGTVIDPEGMRKYGQAAGPILAQYGGRLLSAGPPVEVLEGEPNPGQAIVEFESVEAAQRWYQSPEYQAIIGLRQAANTGWVFIAKEFVVPQG